MEDEISLESEKYDNEYMASGCSIWIMFSWVKKSPKVIQLYRNAIKQYVTYHEQGL